jgi:hypothetical protein
MSTVFNTDTSAGRPFSLLALLPSKTGCMAPCLAVSHPLLSPQGWCLRSHLCANVILARAEGYGCHKQVKCKDVCFGLGGVHLSPRLLEHIAHHLRQDAAKAAAREWQQTLRGQDALQAAGHSGAPLLH